MKKENLRKGGPSKGGGGKQKAIVFAPTLNETVSAREAGNTRLTVPVEYPDGAQHDFNERSVVFNGKTYAIEYEIVNHVVVVNTYITEDGVRIIDTDAAFLKVCNVNGVDTLLYADKEGIKDLDGNVLYTNPLFNGIGPLSPSGNPIYYVKPSFAVTDLDDSGTDDLIVGFSSADAHKVTVVHDFLNNPVETDVLFELTESFVVLDVIDGIGDKFVIFRSGARNCDGGSHASYSQSIVETATPPTSTSELIESMVIVAKPNGNATATVLEFTQLPSCERFYVTVTGINGEYVGYGVGSVKNVDEFGEGYFSLIRYLPDGDNPSSYDIAPGDYWVVFPALPSTADPSQPVKLPLTIA